MGNSNKQALRIPVSLLPLLILLLAGWLPAQEVPTLNASLPEAPASNLFKPVIEAMPANGNAIEPVAPPIKESDILHQRPEHRFWDAENRTLFSVAGGLAGADFWITRSNLASGGTELNPVTRLFTGSTPILASNFVMETGAVIGISYLFHRSGHHKLERWVSVVNIGGSAGAVAFDLIRR